MCDPYFHTETMKQKHNRVGVVAEASLVHLDSRYAAKDSTVEQSQYKGIVYIIDASSI